MGIEGKVIVFTGKISKPRHEFQKLVTDSGGINGSDVSGKTDFLVVGEKPGSKLFRATSLGVPTISEEKFLELLNESEGEETPLSPEEVEKIQSSRIMKTCLGCGKSYLAFESTVDYDTCPICTLKLSPPKCPHCSSPANFVGEYGLYHCTLCGSWFKSYHSSKAPHSKVHICLTYLKGNKSICISCGKTYSVTPEDLLKQKEAFNKAPELAKEIELKLKESSSIREKSKFITSLSDSEMVSLARRLGLIK